MAVIVLGYDPGGKGANGVAIYKRDGSKTRNKMVSTVDSIEDAINWFTGQLSGDTPDALGIDAFLYWNTGPSGWRHSDKWLQEKYPIAGKSVLASNSTFGSMAVQGMALAICARRKWKKIHLNETHPKVLHFCLWDTIYPKNPSNRKSKNWSKENVWPNGENVKQAIERLRKVAHIPDLKIRNDHEWDAMASAWATYQGISNNWKNDLVQETTANDVGDVVFPLGKQGVTYYWPDR